MNKELRFALAEFVDTQVNCNSRFQEEGDLIYCCDEAKDIACHVFLDKMQSWCPDIMPYCVDSYGAALDAIYSDKPNDFYNLLKDIHRQAVACEKRLDISDKWDFGELEFDVLDTLVAIGFEGDFDARLRDAIYLYLEDSLRERISEIWSEDYAPREPFAGYERWQ